MMASEEALQFVRTYVCKDGHKFSDSFLSDIRVAEIMEAYRNHDRGKCVQILKIEDGLPIHHFVDCPERNGFKFCSDCGREIQVKEETNGSHSK